MISILASLIASMMPEFGLTTKMSGWVVRILYAIFFVGELLLMNKADLSTPTEKLILSFGFNVTYCATSFGAF